jgi:hypothetical protein
VKKINVTNLQAQSRPKISDENKSYKSAPRKIAKRRRLIFFLNLEIASIAKKLYSNDHIIIKTYVAVAQW